MGKQLNKFELAVQERYGQLSAQEQKVADFLLAHSSQLAALTLNEITQESGTSKSSVVRFCKSMGAHGLKELKVSFSKPGVGNESTVTWDSSVPQIFNSTFTGIINTVESAFYTTSSKCYEEAGQMIAEAQTLCIIGIGGSELVAHFCATECMRLSKHISTYTDAYMLERLAPPVASNSDVLIAASCSGTTSSIVETARTAKSHGSKIISFTTNGESPLAELSDVVLIAPTYPVFCDDIHSFTRIAQITQANVLYLAAATIMGKTIDGFREQYVNLTNYRKIHEQTSV